MGKEKEIVISTANGNKVAARTVYFVFYIYCIYFVTSKSYEKYKQIEKNSNVALCFFNISMEGVAIIKGHPELEENEPPRGKPRGILRYYINSNRPNCFSL